MTVRLTDAYVKDLIRKRDAGELQPGQKFFDSVCPGLYAFLLKTKVSYCYDYNVCLKRQKITFGESRYMTIAEARQLCMEAKVEAAKLRRERHFERVRALSRGTLAEYKTKRETETLTFEAVVKQFLAKKQKEVSPGTFTNKKRTSAQAVVFFDGRKINEITKAELIAYCNRQQNTNIHRSFLLLREVFTFAAASGYIATSPLNSDDTKALAKGAERGHIEAPSTLPTYAQKLAEAYEAVGDEKAKQVQQSEQRKLLLLNQLLPCRSNELAELKWEDINIEEKTATIYQSKTKKKNVLPLNALALAILFSTKTYAAREGKVFLFHKGTLKNKLNKVNGFSLHSVRSFFETSMIERNQPKQICEAVLGHQKDEYNGAYDRSQSIGQKRKLLNYWTEYLCMNEKIQGLFAAALESLKASAFYPIEYLREFTAPEVDPNALKISRWVEGILAQENAPDIKF